jgi:hypothetical protein
MKIFDNMESGEKLIALLIISSTIVTIVYLIVYLIVSAITGKVS